MHAYFSNIVPFWRPKRIKRKDQEGVKRIKRAQAGSRKVQRIKKIQAGSRERIKKERNEARNNEKDQEKGSRPAPAPHPDECRSRRNVTDSISGRPGSVVLKC